MPAIERYDGPPFRVLRRFLAYESDHERLDIYVLSARYGLIEGSTLIDLYNQCMTEAVARKQHVQNMEYIQKQVAPKQYGEIFLSMGRTYLQALLGLETLLGMETRVIVSEGTSGAKLSKLHSWLWGMENARVEATPLQVAPPITVPRTVVLRGQSITSTTQEVMHILVGALADVGDEARRIHKWYVTINEERISPKWAAQVLFRIPVGQFGADEARRALYQLGVNCFELS